MPFTVYSWPLSQKINLPSHGRENNRPFKCLPKVTCTIPWDDTWSLSLYSFPTLGKWAHYIDHIILTCEDLPLLQDIPQALPEHLQRRVWVVNTQKIQGPVTAIKFGSHWLGKTYIIPETMVDKVQVYPTSKTVNEMQAFDGIWQS